MVATSHDFNQRYDHFVYIAHLLGPPTWQHPDALISEGERLIKSIYEALRKSDLWDSLAFLITYDEHGGFYDHVAPPQTGIPSPDGVPARNGFTYDRLGIRVPTLLISPWVAKSKVVHEPKRGGPHFDATAVIATSNKIFGIKEHMHQRDAWVGTFEDLFEEVILFPLIEVTQFSLTTQEKIVP